MIGMGFDCGTSNAGYTIASFVKKKFIIHEIGQIESTFNNLTEDVIHKKPTKAERALAKKQGLKVKDILPSYPPFSECYPIFYNTIMGIYKDHALNFFVGERFQNRGPSSGGPLIEKISVQLGTIAAIGYANGFKTRFVIASQWKNAVNKIADLESMYEYAAQFGFTPHECDSSGMLLYQASYLDLLPLETGLSQWRAEIARYYKRS